MSKEMTYVAGVDGTPGGWAVVIMNLKQLIVRKVLALSDLQMSQCPLLGVKRRPHVVTNGLAARFWKDGFPLPSNQLTILLSPQRPS